MPIRDIETRKIRAKAMIQARVDGLTIAEVAEKFNVHPQTVVRTLSWARSADLFIEFEDKLMTELLPLAHGSLKRALEEETDGTVALEIYKGRNLLKKQGQKSQIEVQEDTDLADYIRQVRGMADERDRTTEGELVGTTIGQKALPPASQASDEANGTQKPKRVTKGKTKGRKVVGKSSNADLPAV